MERQRRYPSDLTDEQWALIEVMLPLPKWIGRAEKHPRRAIVDAILYVVRTGCSWRQPPVDFPPWGTVYWHFTRWEERGVTERVLEELREQLRVEHGKKINGRKRFIVTDTLGLLIVVCVMAASVQDRDGAKTTMLSAYLASPVRFVLADAGFAGRLVDWAKAILATTLHIVRKPKGQQGFVLIPRRWPVERTFAWLTAYRRLARDYERDPAVSEAMIRWAAISTMARRLTRGSPAVRQQRWHWPETLD